MNFGEWLRNKRESKGMTVNQLGMYSDISGATISRIENGKRGTPKPPTLRKLAEALKMSYEEIMEAAGYLKEDNTNKDIIHEDNPTPYLTEELKKALLDENTRKLTETFYNLSPDKQKILNDLAHALMDDRKK